MAQPFKLACVGGGGRMAPAVAHGLTEAMAAGAHFEPSTPSAIDIALAGAPSARAGRMAEYAALVGRDAGLPIAARLASLEEALDGADLVVCDETVEDSTERLGTVCAAAGWTPPAAGPGAVALACLTGPALMRLGRAAAARCPHAPLVTLTAPSDVLAGAARRRFGIAGLRAVGLGPELEDLRATLAEFFGCPPDQVLLVHGGVDRVGWVVRFAVESRDGYGELGDRLLALGDDARAPSSWRVIPEVYRLTGMIRTSVRQAWPFVLPGGSPSDTPVGRTAEPQSDQAIETALAAGRSIPTPASTHPERSALYALGIGRALGRLVYAMATGELAVVSLQVPYGGEALAWSPEITVEVPAVVGGPQIEPMAVGPLPAGVDGLPRLLGQQRALASDYLAAPEVSVLRRALAATPQWGRTDQIGALADALHAAAAADLEAAARA